MRDGRSDVARPSVSPPLARAPGRLAAPECGLMCTATAGLTRAGSCEVGVGFVAICDSRGITRLRRPRKAVSSLAAAFTASREPLLRRGGL